VDVIAPRPLPKIVAGIAVVIACGLAAAEGLPVNREHAGLGCGDCHSTQPPSKEGVRCSGGECHPDLHDAFRTTAHDVQYLKNLRPACQDCHCGHPVVTGDARMDRACATRAVESCRPCHKAEERNLPGNILLHRLPPGMSRQALPPEGQQKRGCSKVVLRCFSCHGVHSVFPVGDSQSPVNRKHVADTCGACHTHEAEGYGVSGHGRGVVAGVKVAPTCVSCHGAHGVRAVSAVHSPTGKARVVFQCPDCHADPMIIHSADLPLEIVDSYEGTLHGIAWTHGIEGVATCVSCHGSHEILGARDPRSPVNPGRLKATCSQCHAGVTEGMIKKIRHRSGPAGPGTWLGRLRLYFPIAGVSMNPLVAMGIGWLVGFLSGVFGVGGGFLMTPLLVFIGIPAAVAAATDSAQITAGASSGMVSHARLGNVDFKMGLAMVAGSWPGGFLGVRAVHHLRDMGNFDFYLKLLYVLLLGFVGISMFVEGLRALRGISQRTEPGPSRIAGFFSRLALQMEFPKSGLRTSFFEPAAAGLVVGILAAFLGVGGGFILVPVMIYIIGIPTRVAVGTSLFQIMLTCIYVAIEQAASNHTVDLLLALALFFGSTLGAQAGVLASRRLRGEQIRVLLAVIVLGVMLALLYRLMAPPDLLIQFARSGGG